MRAKTKIFHTECFRCFACAVQLLPGKYAWPLSHRKNPKANLHLSGNFRFCSIITQATSLRCAKVAHSTAKRITTFWKNPHKASWRRKSKATTTSTWATTTIPVSWARCQVHTFAAHFTRPRCPTATIMTADLSLKLIIIVFIIVPSNPSANIDSGSESGSHKSIREKRPSGPSDGKPTRVRTVLNEKQLHTLR